MTEYLLYTILINSISVIKIKPIDFILYIILNSDLFIIIILLILRLNKEYKIIILLKYLIICKIINYGIFNNLNKIIMHDFF